MIDRSDTEGPFLPEFCSKPQQQESDNVEWLPQDAVDWQAWLRRRLRELEKQKELREWQEWLRRRVIRWGLQRSGAQHPEQVLQYYHTSFDKQWQWFKMYSHVTVKKTKDEYYSNSNSNFKFKKIFIASHIELRHTINKYDSKYNKCIWRKMAESVSVQSC